MLLHEQLGRTFLCGTAPPITAYISIEVYQILSLLIVIGGKELRSFVVQISMYRSPGYQVMDITASPSEKTQCTLHKSS